MRRSPIWLRCVVLLYVGALVGLPLGFVFQRVLARGMGNLWSALGDPAMDSAIWLTVKVAVIAVPLNVIFGVGTSLWIARHPSRFTRVLDTVIDVPLAVSPIIIGLILELAYAQTGWFGSTLARLGWRVMFSLPGIVLASVFVSLPLVSRQVIPLLREIGDHQEQTAATLGAGPVRIFFTITLRSITWALAYGVSLTMARVIGEYGAVLIVSGNIAMVTQTLTLNIGANFENFNVYQGFVGASLLALASIALLAILSVARHRERTRHEHLAA
jgi:sulfate transport system permease protein